VPSLTTLHPAFRPYAQAFFDYVHAIDGRFVVTSALRSSTEQARLRQRYLLGQSLIYAAPAGRSMHQLGLAFDMARLGVDALSDPLLPQAGALWKSIGGVWHESDPVHFEAPT
jgi:D-alanyl-D-alanine carboxypeptidase